MDGLALTRQIRSVDGELDPRTPIIALTGNADTESVRAALRAGVNG
jgi:CheY-like chemotaxis protein